MRSVLAGAVLAVALLVAGCGGSSEASKSGNQVLADSLKAARSASSYHMAGVINSSSGSIAPDVSVAKGKGLEGSISFSGTPVQIVLVDGNGYLKTSPKGWTQLAGASGAAISHRLAGRWLKFPVNAAQFEPLIAYTRLKTLFNVLELTSSSALQTSGTKTYNGQKAVVVKDVIHNGTFYVAATSPPYPVAATGPGGSAVAFSKWNEPVTLTAPTNVLDVSQLGR